MSWKSTGFSENNTSWMELELGFNRNNLHITAQYSKMSSHKNLHLAITELVYIGTAIKLNSILQVLYKLINLLIQLGLDCGISDIP